MEVLTVQGAWVQECVCASGVELGSRGAMVVHSVRGGAG